MLLLVKIGRDTTTAQHHEWLLNELHTQENLLDWLDKQPTKDVAVAKLRDVPMDKGGWCDRVATWLESKSSLNEAREICLEAITKYTKELN